MLPSALPERSGSAGRDGFSAQRKDLDDNNTNTHKENPMSRSRITSRIVAGGVLCAVAVATPVAANAASPTPEAPTTHNQVAKVDPSDVKGSVKGTSVGFRNDTGSTVWIRKYDKAGAWYSSREIPNGGIWVTQGDWWASDDVEFRIYPTKADADSNRMWNDYVDIDAENPSWGWPYLVVDWKEVPMSENQTHMWKHCKYGTEFWGKRNADSRSFKNFELHMKKGFGKG